MARGELLSESPESNVREVAVGEVRSATWDKPARPRVSVHVSSYNRAGYLTDLVAALEAQDLPPDDYEVVIVDNASTDNTWDELTRLVEESKLRTLGLRIERNTGPAAARNLAVSRSAAPMLAFTDDDCLPSPSWLSGLLDAMAPGVSVAQGRVAPPPDDWATAKPWDHTKWIDGLTPFFETCNVAYRREGFDAVGGFDYDDPVLNRAGGLAFGEDAVLACAVLELGGDCVFAENALVYHRCVRWRFRDHMRAQRNLAGFPGLARRNPFLRRWLKRGIFLSKRSAAFDGALASLALAAVTRQPVLVAGALPWAWYAAKYASWRTHGDKFAAVLLLPGVAATDLAAFVSLAEGSIRDRRVVL